MTESQIDKLMKRYWDFHFDNSYLTKYKTPYGSIWYSIVKEQNNEIVMLVGKPTDDESNKTWFSDGTYFINGWRVFSIEPKEFNESMRRYIIRKFNINPTDISSIF